MAWKITAEYVRKNIIQVDANIQNSKYFKPIQYILDHPNTYDNTGQGPHGVKISPGSYPGHIILSGLDTPYTNNALELLQSFETLSLLESIVYHQFVIYEQQERESLDYMKYAENMQTYVLYYMYVYIFISLLATVISLAFYFYSLLKKFNFTVINLVPQFDVSRVKIFKVWVTTAVSLFYIPFIITLGILAGVQEYVAPINQLKTRIQNAQFQAQNAFGALGCQLNTSNTKRLCIYPFDFAHYADKVAIVVETLYFKGPEAVVKPQIHTLSDIISQNTKFAIDNLTNTHMMNHFMSKLNQQCINVPVVNQISGIRDTELYAQLVDDQNAVKTECRESVDSLVKQILQINQKNQTIFDNIKQIQVIQQGLQEIYKIADWYSQDGANEVMKMGVEVLIVLHLLEITVQICLITQLFKVASKIKFMKRIIAKIPSDEFDKLPPQYIISVKDIID
ncbi:Hypothetical_protein [Hexamita inflata]|uniref:Hypothetical_protein n=1 Tax=Hexamita inflata TaxID=28002 RepID=A0ABP1I0P0_9EUKA